MSPVGHLVFKTSEARTAPGGFDSYLFRHLSSNGIGLLNLALAKAGIHVSCAQSLGQFGYQIVERASQ